MRYFQFKMQKNLYELENGGAFYEKNYWKCWN